MNQARRNSVWGARQRRGAAIVEMAVVSPLLLTMIFGVIEFGNAFMIRQMLTNSAREGARVAAIQAVVNDTEIRDAVKDAMAALGGLEIGDSDIVIKHWCKAGDGTPDFTESVQVKLTYDQIAIFGTFFGDWQDLVAKSSMRKEGVTEDSDPPGSGVCG